MKNLIRLTDYTSEDIYEIFNIADEVTQGKYTDILRGKSVVLFFQNCQVTKPLWSVQMKALF